MRRCSTARVEPIRVTFGPAPESAVLAPIWRALETRADPSFFTSWTWLGPHCAAAKGQMRLLRAETIDGVPLALALIGRPRPRWPWPSRRCLLNQTGLAAIDHSFIEHNDLLIATEAPPETRVSCLRRLRHGTVIAAGVAPEFAKVLRAAGLRVTAEQARPAPIADLTRGGREALLGTHTRQQVRRALRGYQALGPVCLQRASTSEQALEWLNALAALHQAAWQRRGQPGSFSPAFHALHRAIVAAGFVRDEIDLLRASAGAHVIGYLYNFRYRGRVSAYQSGFDYPNDPRLKPGLVAHVLAMDAARTQGCRYYDFLAGDSRFKRSLADAAPPLLWLRADPPWSPHALVARLGVYVSRKTTPIE